MKKVISLFIVFSMVTALITAHTSAEGNTFTSVFTPGWSVQGGGSYSVNTTAIFGQSEKTKNYYYNFIETPNTNRALMQWKNAGIDEAFDVDSGEGIDYLVFESRFVPSDAITAVSLMTDGSSTTATMPKDRGGWVNGHWNSLKIVQSVADRKTDFYINGVLKYTCTASVFKKGGVYDYRLAYIGTNAYTENAVYINDSKLYGVKGENPGTDTMPFLEGYNYIGRDIFIAPDTKVSNFTSDIYNVRVYEGESFERIREENETAEYGDCLVVEDKSGVFSTFSIKYDGCDVLLYDKKAEKFNDGSSVYETGKYGKAADDETLKITDGTEGTVSMKNPNGYSFYTAEINIVPCSDLESIRLIGDGVMAEIENGWQQDMWNHVKFVYDTENVKAYVNGQEIYGKAATSEPGGKIGIGFTKSGNENLYLDDYKIEIYRDEPLSAKPAVPAKGTVIGNAVITDDNTSAADMKTDGAELTVFKDSTMKEQLSEETVLEKGNVLVYRTAKNLYSTFVVVNNNKAAGKTDIALNYNSETYELKIYGKLSKQGKALLNMTPADEMPDGKYKSGTTVSVIASDSEGNIDYTLKLGKKFIGRIYNCEISFENYKYSAQILVLDSNAVKDCVEKVNAADRAEIEKLLKSEIKSVGLDDGKVKDYTYMADLIYTMRPQSGYTNNDFINVYKISEGLAEINKKLITFEEFLSKYSIYLDDDYAGLFSALDSNVKKDMEILFTNRLDAGTSFKEMFETGIEFTGYRLAKTAIKLKEWFMGFAKKNNVSMTKYNSLNNTYKQEKVFEAMFKTRSSVYTKRMITDAFNTAVDGIYKDTNKDTGGGGGGAGGSSKKSSGGFSALTEPVTTPAPAYETNTAVSENLSDISGHWAEKSIKVLADKKILNGYTDKTFRPDEDITRAEFAKVIFSALGMKEKSENGFIDVTENDWYFGVVSALADIGIVVGADGYFMPQKNISRQDIAVMVQRLFDYMNLTPEKSEQVSYKDAEDITDYALSAVNNLTEIGLLNGSDGCFYPHKNATRAETAEIIYKVIGLTGLN